MPWSKFDDDMWSHPKILDCLARSVAAFALWVLAINYSSRFLTDGRLRRPQLSLLAAQMAGVDDLEELIEVLVDCALIDPGDDGSFQVHDYLVYNPRAEKVKADRKAAKTRMRDLRAKRSGERSDDVRPNMNGTDDERAEDVRTPRSRSRTQDPIPGGSSEPLSLAAEAPERERDLLFEAVSECWLGVPYEQVALTDSQRGNINKCVAQLRGIDADPEEVPVQWDRLRQRVDNPTPAALAKHWGTNGTGPREEYEGGAVEFGPSLKAKYDAFLSGRGPT